MKRSEMIDEIMCVLLAHSVTYPQFPLANLKEAAEELLAMQEKAGMIPPKILNPKVKSESFYDPTKSDTWNIIEVIDYYRGEIPYEGYINQWEEE
jgi:hypothetical protein